MTAIAGRNEKFQSLENVALAKVGADRLRDQIFGPGLVLLYRLKALRGGERIDAWEQRLNELNELREHLAIERVDHAFNDVDIRAPLLSTQLMRFGGVMGVAGDNDAEVSNLELHVSF